MSFLPSRGDLIVIAQYIERETRKTYLLFQDRVKTNSRLDWKKNLSQINIKKKSIFTYKIDSHIGYDAESCKLNMSRKYIKSLLTIII